MHPSDREGLLKTPWESKSRTDFLKPAPTLLPEPDTLSSTRAPHSYRPRPFLCVLPQADQVQAGAEHSPPVRLKEFPKAENELRGVKSGLLGLLIGLHGPELDVPGRKATQEGVSWGGLLCAAPWGSLTIAPGTGALETKAGGSV